MLRELKCSAPAVCSGFEFGKNLAVKIEFILSERARSLSPTLRRKNSKCWTQSYSGKIYNDLLILTEKVKSFMN